jgi:hypothetical protein
LINGSDNPWSYTVFLVWSAIWLILIMRFGLVTTAIAGITGGVIFSELPTTLDVSAWYSGYSFAALAIFAVIVLYAFRTSLGGRPLLAPSRFDD